jgi:hypothetical protein
METKLMASTGFTKEVETVKSAFVSLANKYGVKFHIKYKGTYSEHYIIKAGWDKVDDIADELFNMKVFAIVNNSQIIFNSGRRLY